MVVPLLNIPIISVVLLLLAGILIGHLIWYRDRSDDEAALVDMRAENSELQAALHEHKQAYVELQADMEDRRKGWEQLKATNLQLEQAQQTSQYDLTEVNSELARLQQLKDQAFHDLDQERQQRRAMQEALAQAEQNTLRANSLTEQLQSQISSFETQRAAVDQRMNRDAEWAALESDLQSQIAAVSEERDAVARERDSLLHRLETAQEDDHVIASLNEQHETLRQQVADSHESLTNLESQLRQRDEDLASLRSERDEALQQVEDERESRARIEGRVGNVEQLVAQRDAALESVRDLEKNLAESNARMQQLSDMLEEKSLELHVLQNSHEEAKLELKQETDVLRQKLAALTQEHDAVSQVLIDERSRLSGMESENHRLTAMAAEAESIAVSNNQELRTELSRKQVELDTLRTELEEIASQLSRERHQREHLQSVLHEHKTTTSVFEKERADWEQQLASLQSQNEMLQTQVSKLAALRDEHDFAGAELQRLQEQYELTTTEKLALEQRVSELNQSTSQLTKQVTDLQVARDEQATELDRLQETHRTAITSRIELESAKEELEQHVRKLQSELDEVREVKQSHVELKTRLDRVIAQRDEAMHTHSSQEETISQLQQQLRVVEEACDAEKLKHEEVAQRTAGFDDLRRSYLHLQTQLNDTGDRLRRVTVERDSQRDAINNAEARLAQLDERAKANEETIRNLRRERAAVLANTRQPSSLSFHSLATRSVPEQESGGRMRRDDVLGMVYTQPPKRKDDLKRISGIAQVLEKKLNAFGVYTYRQIMEWDAVAIAEFSKLLSFRDRIDRDDWIGQARNLQYENYGRAA